MPYKTPKRSRKVKIFILAAIIGGFIYITNQPDHAAEAQKPTPPKPAYAATITWPETARAAAIGVQGKGVVAAHNDTKPRPIASIAKVITALAILEKKPLKGDESGPLIPITEKDEQRYRDYVAQNGTVVLIKAGVPITQRDALEAMLLPSANNVADTAAVWAFGSLKNYQEYANAMLKRLGLHDTTVGSDASGLDPGTTSTASDLVRLGEIALKHDVLAHIVALPAAYIPFAGDIPNYNAMVTKYGYSGLKPGESVQGGNTLLFSTTQTVNGAPETVIGAILGTENYRESNAGALAMVTSFVRTATPTR